MSSNLDYKFLFFSLSPASYIHPSWLKYMQVDKVFSWGFGATNREKLLSEFLMEYYGLDNIDPGSFSHQEKEFFISSIKKTKLLVCYLGIVYCQDLLKRHILKNQVRAIKKNFGENAYAFGLKKAPYLLKARDFSFPENRNSLDIRGEIIAYGMACLQAYLSIYTDDIKRRVFWKLPRDWQANDFEISNDNARCLVNAVIREVK